MGLDWALAYRPPLVAGETADAFAQGTAATLAPAVLRKIRRIAAVPAFPADYD